jgi:transketolase
MVETAVAWKVALEKKTGPSCFALTRQGLPHQTRTAQQINDIPRGGYILKDCKGDPQCILLATGSEVGLAMEAADTLQKKGINTRVVSMPCTSLFDAQDDAYKTSVLSPNCKARVAIEAGVSDYWYKYVGLDGKVIGIDRFGESAPAKHLFKFFGLTSDNIVKTVEGII